MPELSPVRMTSADTRHTCFSVVLCKKWSGTRFPGSQNSSAPGPAARAQQLADVSLFVYEAGGSTIHLPLEPSHALVAVLKKALEREGKERPGKEWLVSFVLSVQQGSPIIIAHITSQGS